MMLVVLNCGMKTSLWTFLPRLAFALLLGAFSYWSIDYAEMQSKTQIDNWLHREDVLQGIAIIVTLESAIGLMYCFSCLNDDGKRPRRRFIRLLLHAYPSLLIFPVVFYGLTKLLFLHVGMDFSNTSLIYAIAVIAVSLSCATLARWLFTKLGPVLGLIGTLISMSPALVGLSTGDISGMAYNMQVVFSATVVGLVISAVGLFTQQLKTRWYAKDVNNLDYVSRIYAGSYEKEA